MTRRHQPPEDPKVAALRAAGALHSHPDAVRDEAFGRHEFFDRLDRVPARTQVHGRDPRFRGAAPR